MSFGGMNLGLPCLEETVEEKIDHHYLFIYSFQDMTSTVSNNNLLCILIGKVLINDSLILHYHKNKK